MSYGKVDLIKLKEFKDIVEKLASINAYDVVNDKHIKESYFDFMKTLTLYIQDREEGGTSIKRRENTQVKTFITIYRNRYSLYYTRPPQGLNKISIAIIKKFLDKLDNIKSDSDDYLKWFFEDYIEQDWIQHPITINLVLSDNTFEKYCYKLKQEGGSNKEKQEQINDMVINTMFARLKKLNQKCENNEEKEKYKKLAKDLYNDKTLYNQIMEEVKKGESKYGI